MKNRYWTLYVLELENGYYYVGITRDVSRRIRQHVTGRGGAMFVKKHPAVGVALIAPLGTYLKPKARLVEDIIVGNYAHQYGHRYVGGGSEAEPWLQGRGVRRL